MGRARELAYEILDLCQQYNATIRACKDRIVIDVPGDEHITQVGAITGELIEWDDLILREEPPASLTYELTKEQREILSQAGQLPGQKKGQKCPS